MARNSVQKLRDLGQSVWCDQISREMLQSGELASLRDLGVTGVTSNPTIFEKAVSAGSQYDAELEDLARKGVETERAFEILAERDIRDACDLFLPVFESTKGADGFVSIEVSPHLAYQTDETVADARRLWSQVGRPNVMIKVPGTPEGIPAFRTLIGEGINVNVTLLFDVNLYVQVANAYIDGLESLRRSGGDPSAVASVASFFVSRVDTAVDAGVQSEKAKGKAGLDDLLGVAAVANARLAYARFKEIFGAPRFAALRERGAKVQRCLWASTSTKNPAYSDVLYVQELIAPDTVNTTPPVTINAWLDHGEAHLTLEKGIADAERAFRRLTEAGIDLAAVTHKLMLDGVKSFAASYDLLLQEVAEKAKLLARA